MTGWERVGQAVRARRFALGLTQQEFADEHGVSLATLNVLELAKQGSYRGLTLAAVERGLGWAPGSIERIRQGHQPVLEEVPTPPPAPEEPEGFEDKVLRTLAELAEALDKLAGRVAALEEGAAKKPARRQKKATK